MGFVCSYTAQFSWVHFLYSSTISCGRVALSKSNLLYSDFSSNILIALDQIPIFKTSIPAELCYLI